MINNAILSWNNIQKIISSHVLRELSYSKLKTCSCNETLSKNLLK